MLYKQIIGRTMGLQHKPHRQGTTSWKAKKSGPKMLQDFLVINQ